MIFSFPAAAPTIAPVTRTALEAITAALQTIGVIGPGDPVDPSIAAQALARFQDLIDAFGTNPMLAYSVTPVTKVLTAGQASYTLGGGGDIDRVWPTWIDHAGLILPGTAPTTELPIALLTENEQAELQTKALSDDPVAAYHDKTFPLATITVYPVPARAGLTLVLYIPVAFTEPVDLTSVIAVPPGNRRMFRYNLASELADEFGAVGPHIDRIHAKAVSTMADVKNATDRPSVLKGRPEMVGDTDGGAWDWRNGGFT